MATDITSSGDGPRFSPPGTVAGWSKSTSCPSTCARLPTLPIDSMTIFITTTSFRRWEPLESEWVREIELDRPQRESSNPYRRYRRFRLSPPRGRLGDAPHRFSSSWRRAPLRLAQGAGLWEPCRSYWERALRLDHLRHASPFTVLCHVAGFDD